MIRRATLLRHHDVSAQAGYDFLSQHIIDWQGPVAGQSAEQSG